MRAIQPADIHADIVKVVDDVFTQMLGESVRSSQPAPKPARNKFITAAVFFVGAWKGAAILECSQSVASRLSSRLLSIAESDNSDEAVRDSMGEIANMIGGNLKAVLPGGVYLSPPSITAGGGYEHMVCGACSEQLLSFSCESGTFWLTLVEIV